MRLVIFNLKHSETFWISRGTQNQDVAMLLRDFRSPPFLKFLVVSSQTLKYGGGKVNLIADHSLHGIEAGGLAN